MGRYLNPTDRQFMFARNSAVYVDKSEVIALTNSKLGTSQRFLCATRPRRFGKTVTLDMLSAYYQRRIANRSLFSDLKIAGDPSFEEHLNRYDVVSLTMTSFFNLEDSGSIAEGIENLISRVTVELRASFGTVDFSSCQTFASFFERIAEETGSKFVVLIDEWDCVFRMFEDDVAGHRLYLDFLKNWLENQQFASLVYMTGILPAGKLWKDCAPNGLVEYSMVNAREMTPFVGFTGDEVREICERHQLDHDECRALYDGYRMNAGAEYVDVFNPLSVVLAAGSGRFKSYWGATESVESLKRFIALDIDGLREKILFLLAGNRVRADVTAFGGGTTGFRSADDVLALLVHLGYLGYDSGTCEVFVPNFEVALEFAKSVRYLDGWSAVAKAIEDSGQVLEACTDGGEEVVARAFGWLHDELAELGHNEGNTLACVMQLSLHAAGRFFDIVPSKHTGKGFAAIALVPKIRKFGLPAIVVEMKFSEFMQSGIGPDACEEFAGMLASFADFALHVSVDYYADQDVQDSWWYSCNIRDIDFYEN